MKEQFLLDADLQPVTQSTFHVSKGQIPYLLLFIDVPCFVIGVDLIREINKGYWIDMLLCKRERKPNILCIDYVSELVFHHLYRTHAGGHCSPLAV